MLGRKVWDKGGGSVEPSSKYDPKPPTQQKEGGPEELGEGVYASEAQP